MRPLVAALLLVCACAEPVASGRDGGGLEDGPSESELGAPDDPAAGARAGGEPTAGPGQQGATAAAKGPHAASGFSLRPVGDPEQGRALVERLECGRCHEGLSGPEVPLERHCVRCHQDIREDRYPASAAHLRRWKARMVSMLQTPSLRGSRRLRAAWIADFLAEPHDLRPRLAPTMIRTATTAQERADIAAWLGTAAPPQADLTSADARRGRALFGALGCGKCHVLSGAGLGPMPPLEHTAEGQSALRALAPDLRHVRARMGSATVVAWIGSPRSVKDDAAMPEFGLSARDARDLARFILGTPLAPPPPRVVPERLPPLGRKVRFAEVAREVLHDTCWHCHADPPEEDPRGDGGPGSTGGFGFMARGVSFASHASTLGGGLDDRGQRRSLTEPGPEGTPRLLLSLLARQAEEAGRPIEGIRGMPMGLPALSPEKIQLVETWLAQGARP